MLFKFTLNLLGVTIIALALYGCPPKDGETGDNGDKLSLKTGSGTATLESNGNVKVTATVLKGDDPAEGVEVVFSVKCGDTAVVFDKATTGDDGVATATKAVAGATAATLGACDVTASLNDEGSHVVRAKSGGGNTPTDEKIMGKVYELSWDANDSHDYPCEDILLLKVNEDGEPEGIISPSDLQGGITNQTIVVLPASADATCTLNDKDKTEIKANPDAFSYELPTCNSNTPCWERKEDGMFEKVTDTSSDSGMWITKNANGYVLHDMVKIMGKVYTLSWEAADKRDHPCYEGEVHLFTVNGDGAPTGLMGLTIEWKAEITNQKIVALPAGLYVRDCTLNDKDKTKIRANPDAFSSSHPTCSKENPCWDVHNPTNIVPVVNRPTSDGMWIRKDGTSYIVHHVVL